MILDSDADNILPGWNASNKSWAPDAPCQPGIVAQEKGPWPGIWLDNAAWKFGSACSNGQARAVTVAATLTPTVAADRPIGEILQGAQGAGRRA